MPSIFTVRDRILLHLLDAGKGTWVFRADICRAVHSHNGNACVTFQELIEDKLIVRRRATGIKGGSTSQFSITEKGLAVAMTQVWRMRSAGVKSITQLPHSNLGAKPKVVA